MRAFLLLLLLHTGYATADSIPPQVYELLKYELQDLRFSHIDPAQLPITASPTDPNYYQAIIGSYVFEISADGSFAMRNPYIDASFSAADERQARRAALAALDTDSTIRYLPAYAPPAYRLTVFTDVTCPYCARFHQQIPHLLVAGVEVRYLAFPRQGLDSRGHADNAAIWCSLNPPTAMDAAFDGIHVTARRCNDPIAAHYALGDSFGLDGTPALLFDDGSLFMGYYDAIDIIRYLRGEPSSLKDAP